MLKLIELPTVHMQVSEDKQRLFAQGSDPVPWLLEATFIDEDSGRLLVHVDGNKVADVTVHATCNEPLSDEIQTIGAALLWSAIRALETRSNKESISTAAIGESAEAEAIVRDLADEDPYHPDGHCLYCWRRRAVPMEHATTCPYLRARAFVAREGREETDHG